MEEILERIEKLEQENEELKQQVKCINSFVREYPNLKMLSDDIQKWVLEEYSPVVQQWFVEEVAPEIQDWITGPYSDLLQEWIEKYVTEQLNGRQSIKEKLKEAFSKYQEDEENENAPHVHKK